MQVTWVVDPRGWNGKTMLAKVLVHCYGFERLDGLIKKRDLGFLLKDPMGIVVDITRAEFPSLEYGAIEALKDG